MAEAATDHDRAARKLARHTLLTVMDMAKEEKLSPDTVVAMFSSMADAHRQAAKIIDRRALLVKLNLAGLRR